MNQDRIDVLHAVTSSLSLRLLRGQLRYLKAHGFRTAVLCGPGPFVEETRSQETVPVFTIRMERESSPLRDFVSLLRICRLLRHLRPTICNVGTPKAGMLVSLAAWLIRVPCRIYTLRGLRLETAHGLKRRILFITELIACACVHRVVCVSPSLRERAVELGLVRREKTTVLASGSSNGIDPSRFVPTPERLARVADIRRRLRLPPGCAVIGYIGRFTKDKGISELLAAFQSVRKHFPDVQLLLIGEYEQGNPVPRETQKAIESTPGIFKIDFQTDIAPYFLAMEIFVLPTHREGFPNTVLEAQAAERPVVTTHATGAIDSVVDGVTGMLVPVGDVAALSDALLKLLSDPVRARQMGCAGRDRICREFCQETIWGALAALYDEMMPQMDCRCRSQTNAENA
ncbi:MAG TPA: glycosyltransferase family 4 protein [Edaphobacter sp.]|nr:glycosyltransferase family 4 protein [Edaphobacter sp.]